MTREEAHNLLDALFDAADNAKLGGMAPVFPKQVGTVEFGDPSEGGAEIVEAETVERVLPEGQRVVRTKTSGDRVYLLDDTKKTRAWVTNIDVLKGLGFEMSDVGEVDDVEMLKYNMAPALYKVPNAA